VNRAIVICGIGLAGIVSADAQAPSRGQVQSRWYVLNDPDCKITWYHKVK
jgi:hypothetical protein